MFLVLKVVVQDPGQFSLCPFALDALMDFASLTLRDADSQLRALALATFLGCPVGSSGSTSPWQSHCSLSSPKSLVPLLNPETCQLCRTLPARIPLLT